MKYQLMVSSLCLLSVTACDLYRASPVVDSAQQAWQAIDHYQVNEGVAVDSRTGLMWTRCMIGSTWVGMTCQGTPATYNGQQAQAIAKSFIYAGYGDWRIPTLEELKTLAYKEGNPPAVKVLYLNDSVFPMKNCLGTQNEPGIQVSGHTCGHWSSTPIEGADRFFSIVYFGYGYSNGNFDSDDFSLRLVRNSR